MPPKEKKERAFKLTREKKKKLKVLILRKAQEDLEKEAKKKEEERVNAINELVPPLHLDDYDEASEDLEGKILQLYTWIWETEEKRLNLEYQLVTQDSEMNDLTVQMNEASGKFVKPQLKRVNKTQAKFKKNQGESDSAKAAAFRSGLKTSGAGPDSKFTLGDDKNDDKPDYALDKKKKKGKRGTDDDESHTSATEGTEGAEGAE